MDIKIIISMFEDLKKLISEQFSNLSKLVESLANAKSDQPALPIIPQQVDLSELENHASHTKELIQEGFKKHQEQLDELGQKLEKQQNKPLPVQKHLHTIELKSSKVVIALISLGVALFSSVCYNVYQFSLKEFYRSRYKRQFQYLRNHVRTLFKALKRHNQRTGAGRCRKQF